MAQYFESMVWGCLSKRGNVAPWFIGQDRTVSGWFHSKKTFNVLAVQASGHLPAVAETSMFGLWVASAACLSTWWHAVKRDRTNINQSESDQKIDSKCAQKNLSTYELVDFFEKKRHTIILLLKCPNWRREQSLKRICAYSKREQSWIVLHQVYIQIHWLVRGALICGTQKICIQCLL